MLIPIRCMTCGKPVAHLWEDYNKAVKKGQNPAAVMDKLGIERFCCRSLFVTHVDLVDRIGQFKK
jgi:DNA-directed RNA polymerase subunit N